MSMPASAWAAWAASRGGPVFEGFPADRIVREAPCDDATSTARATAFLAVSDPSVPTRMRWYMAVQDTGRDSAPAAAGALITSRSSRWLSLGGTRLRQLDGRGLEALDRREAELGLLGLLVLDDVDHDELPGAELLVEELLGQCILDEALDGPTQRAGAEGGVVPA